MKVMKMKKTRRLTITLLTLILIIMNSITVFAADDADVVYSGGSDTAVFEFEPGASFDYSGLMPGDTSSQTLTIMNESTDDIIIRLAAEELVNNEFLSNIDLTITETKDGDSVVLFDGKVSELTDETKVNYNSSRFSDGISRYYIALSDYIEGDTGELLFTLTIPEDLGNAYQGTVGEVTWALYLDIATVAGTTETGETTRPPTILNEVATGDYAPIFWVSVALVVSTIVICVVYARKSKKQKEN